MREGKPPESGQQPCEFCLVTIKYGTGYSQQLTPVLPVGTTHYDLPEDNIVGHVYIRKDRSDMVQFTIPKHNKEENYGRDLDHVDVEGPTGGYADVVSTVANMFLKPFGELAGTIKRLILPIACLGLAYTLRDPKLQVGLVTLALFLLIPRTTALFAPVTDTEDILNWTVCAAIVMGDLSLVRWCALAYGVFEVWKETASPWRFGVTVANLQLYFLVPHPYGMCATAGAQLYTNMPWTSDWFRRLYSTYGSSLLDSLNSVAAMACILQSWSFFAPGRKKRAELVRGDEAEHGQADRVQH
jgi:hypothetical protein